jgi:hypothetical protein
MSRFYCITGMVRKVMAVNELERLSSVYGMIKSFVSLFYYKTQKMSVIVNLNSLCTARLQVRCYLALVLLKTLL